MEGIVLGACTLHKIWDCPAFVLSFSDAVIRIIFRMVIYAFIQSFFWASVSLGVSSFSPIEKGLIFSASTYIIKGIGRR